MEKTIYYHPWRVVAWIVLAILIPSTIFLLVDRLFTTDLPAMVISIEDGPLTIPLGRYLLRPGEWIDWVSDDEDVVRVIKNPDEVQFAPVAPGQTKVCGKLFSEDSLVREECRRFLVTKGRSSSI